MFCDNNGDGFFGKNTTLTRQGSGWHNATTIRQRRRESLVPNEFSAIAGSERKI
jgi:hypothetical protein